MRPRDGSGSTGAVEPPRAAYAAANPSDALPRATSAGANWLLVTDADVRALASGIVTPAPLTVGYEHIGKTWDVLDEYQNVVGKFYREADARAFVALPALLEAGKVLVELAHQVDDTDGLTLEQVSAASALCAALAQADGPAPTEERDGSIRG